MKCTKVAYGTKQKAHRAMQRIAKSGKVMRVYLCETGCFKWHLTSDVKVGYKLA